MAIQKSIESQMGFTAANAYIRIAGFTGNKENVRCQIEIFYDSAARQASKRPIAMDIVQLNLSDGATMAQQYTALKALPQYAGAVDC